MSTTLLALSTTGALLSPYRQSRAAQPRLCEAEAPWSDAWRRGKGMSIGSQLSDRLANVDEDAVRRAAQALSAPSWDEIGSLLPEAECLLEAERASGRGPTDVAANLRLFDLPDGATPRVTLWRDQSAWCPYCQKVILQLEEKRVPYAVRRAPMKCYAGGALQKPQEFLELSKAGLLPVATIDGALYSDSASILEAVEREFPEHAPLKPSTDGERRAFEAAAALERSVSGAWLSWLTTPSWLPGEAERPLALA
jgi:hypothetical protein